MKDLAAKAVPLPAFKAGDLPRDGTVPIEPTLPAEPVSASHRPSSRRR